ncbi:InlB B-repeat-containing protein [Termitidicoccus mucosus]|uniref:InlB B-repeat-containing protein n=1 Tax=Termitidicoccus mucosus TaxID=1184151 RepID=UPI0031837334
MQVTFDAGEGATVSPATKTVTRELPYGTLPVPVKPGYTFAGWFTEPEAAGTEATQTTIVPDLNNHSLHAAWVELPQSVPVITNNYSAEQVVAVGRSFTLTATASGSPAPTYLWQISTDGGKSWSDLSPTNSNYSGVLTSTLKISRINAGMDGYLFRYRAVNVNGTTYSDPVKLVAAEAIFAGPADLAFDSAGTLYVADTPANIIRRIDTSGSTSVFAGASASGALLDATGTAARFNQPTAIAFNAAGELLVADKDNGVIRKITSDAQVTTFATGLGKPVALAIDASARSMSPTPPTTLSAPWTPTAPWLCLPASLAPRATPSAPAPAPASTLPGVTIDNDGYLFVADTGNNTLRTPDSLGVFLHYAGTPGIVGTADGDAPDALLNNLASPPTPPETSTSQTPETTPFVSSPLTVKSSPSQACPAFPDSVTAPQPPRCSTLRKPSSSRPKASSSPTPATQSSAKSPSPLATSPQPKSPRWPLPPARR